MWDIGYIIYVVENLDKILKLFKKFVFECMEGFVFLKSREWFVFFYIGLI